VSASHSANVPEQPTTVVPAEYPLLRSEAAAFHPVRSLPPISRPLKLSILMPVYNEEATIVDAVSEVLQVDYPCNVELIVVDDGSTDSTGLLLSEIQDERLIVTRHFANKGKGAALRSGAAMATGTHLLPFDADLEYDPEDIPRILEPVLRSRCAVVYGVRLFGCNTVYQSYWYAIGNRFLTRMANILFDASINDLHTCLKLMPLAWVRGLNLTEEGFGLDTEMTALLLRLGIRPFEVPISYYSRTHAEGKKITWRDAVACAWILLRVRFRSHGRCAIANMNDSGARTDSISSDQHDLPKVIRVTA
jgi:glycosyltransferase involved in cell wall biosynthesis